jgi:hypothetical protein
MTAGNVRGTFCGSSSVLLLLLLLVLLLLLPVPNAEADFIQRGRNLKGVCVRNAAPQLAVPVGNACEVEQAMIVMDALWQMYQDSTAVVYDALACGVAANS